MNNKLLTIFQVFGLMLMLTLIPLANAVTTGVNIGINITPGSGAPQVWQNSGARTFTDMFGAPLSRNSNYAFTGEKITWQVLVRNLNGVGDTSNVVSNLNQGLINLTPSTCLVNTTQPSSGINITWANGGIVFNPLIDKLYNCILTVQPNYNGIYNALVSASSVNSGLIGTTAQSQSFFLNPSIGLAINGANNGLNFGNVMPGGTGYSQTINLQSTVSQGSGVIMKIEIKGNDFYGGTLCPTSNQLTLSNFRYYSTNGAASTQSSPTKDNEGYDLIGYTYSSIIKGAPASASQLNEGAQMPITFKLNLPIPCIGTFNQGDGFSFQGTAI